MSGPGPDSPLVLYVDDESANRIVFQHNFGARFRIQLVADAAQALAALEQEVPAVVVSDQRMPGMVGTQLLARVRERSPETVRVILTAYSDPEPMLEAINTGGVQRYIVKPWEPAEMMRVLEGAVDAYRLQCERRKLELQLFELNRFVALGQLSASVAHDMTSPLSALLANVERLTDHAAALQALRQRLAGQRWLPAEQEAAEELPEITEEVRRSVEYLVELVKGIRVSARPGGGEARAEPRAVLGWSASLARAVAAENGGRVHVAETQAPPVRLTSVELMQVLVNLLTNAAQALHRRLPERRIELSAVEEGEGVEFQVLDTGPGMTPEQVAKAGRERFTTKPEGVGTGLGLSIVRNIVEAAGGRFRLESEPGQGTRVRVWIPKA